MPYNKKNIAMTPIIINSLIFIKQNFMYILSYNIYNIKENFNDKRIFAEKVFSKALFTADFLESFSYPVHFLSKT